MRSATILSGLGALFSAALAAPLSDSPAMSPRQTCEFDSASSPSCWGDYSLSTNWYDESPDTGVTREYWFEIQETTVSPDGVERLGFVINGTVPGPTIYADWGDQVVVHFTNAASHNGTSVHFHGIRQNHTTQNDGVASITQCPTAPGDIITYKWKATQYGTTWYHSHYSLQAWNGVFGGIIINGPASAPYDEDKGILMLNDWYHSTTDELWPAAQTGGPPPAQNGLINGTNTFGSGGSRFQDTVTSGTSYRYHIVNGAMDTHFRFMIDNHTLTVIAADLVPIEPYNTTSINIGIGQRYDVIVHANQDAGNYWMRAIPQTTCSATNENTLNIKGIFNYDGVDVADPATTMYSYTDGCAEESITPYLALDVDSATTQSTFDVGLGTTTGLFKWQINNNTFLSDWDEPTLGQVIDGVTTFDRDQQVVTLDEANEWVYWIIETAVGVFHPIHLHGHDFYVLARGTGTYDSSVTLNLSNPPRRDVTMLPGGGYVVMAYKTDNPGVWLMHCHIGWHASEGLALQLVEQASLINSTVDASIMDDTCDKWNAYQAAGGAEQDDSGI